MLSTEVQTYRRMHLELLERKTPLRGKYLLKDSREQTVFKSTFPKPWWVPANLINKFLLMFQSVLIPQ